MSLIPYESRIKAGELLVQFVLKTHSEIFHDLKVNSEDIFVFTIPNGGIPVAEGFCKILNLKYDLLIVRKIKIPYNPEAGFGAVTTDGTVLINQMLLSQLHLSKEQIDSSIQKTKIEIQDRIIYYKKQNIMREEHSSHIQNKVIFIMDDGLASGFTMLAGIKMIKKYKPKKIYVCVPTAPYHTILLLKNELDDIICPNIRKTTWFAVADAYKHWYDVPDSEVLEILSQSKSYINNK